MSAGLQDAFNLGWKLATVARGEALEGLLATYQGSEGNSWTIIAAVRWPWEWCRPGIAVPNRAIVWTGLGAWSVPTCDVRRV